MMRPQMYNNTIAFLYVTLLMCRLIDDAQGVRKDARTQRCARNAGTQDCADDTQDIMKATRTMDAVDVVVI